MNSALPNPNSALPGYDPGLARLCAQTCARVYTGAATIETDLCHVLIQDFRGEMFSDFRIIAFRGSKSIQDWITDGRFGLQSIPCGAGNARAHAGFYESTASILAQLRNWLATHPLKGPTYITGHSLGGAQAVISALQGSFDFDGVYTFGQPRAGNAAFAALCGRQFGFRHWRVVNEEDIVPRSPDYVFLGYRHSGQCVFFPSIGGGPRFNPPIWKMFLSDLWGTYRDWRRGQIALLADHHIDRYLAKLS